MKRTILVLMLALCAGMTNAAVIKGNIYDFNLELTDALVGINTTPDQRIVADGSYSLEAPPGIYTITATKKEGDEIVAYSEDQIRISQEGTFIIDLILFPVVDVNDTDDNISDIPDPDEFNFFNGKPYLPFVILILLALVIGALVFRMKKPGEKISELDDDAQKILDYVKKHKRVTQKKIRKEFPYSQSKISLILADLEDKGEIRKVKKGRGNIIIKT